MIWMHIVKRQKPAKKFLIMRPTCTGVGHINIKEHVDAGDKTSVPPDRVNFGYTMLLSVFCEAKHFEACADKGGDQRY